MFDLEAEEVEKQRKARMKNYVPKKRQISIKKAKVQVDQDKNRIKQVSKDFDTANFEQMVESVEELQGKIESKIDKDAAGVIQERVNVQYDEEEGQNALLYKEDDEEQQSESETEMCAKIQVGVGYQQLEEKDSQTFDISDFVSEKKVQLIQSILTAQRDLFMKQYDIEWSEIQQKTNNLVNSSIEPYILRVQSAEQLLTKAVSDIRNQEQVLTSLQTAVFNKQLIDLTQEKEESAKDTPTSQSKEQEDKPNPSANEKQFNKKDRLAYKVPNREEFLNIPKLAEKTIFDDIKRKMISMQQQISDNKIETKAYFEDTQLYVRQKLKNIYTRQEAEESYADLRSQFSKELKTTREVADENKKQVLLTFERANLKNNRKVI